MHASWPTFIPVVLRSQFFICEGTINFWHKNTSLFQNRTGNGFMLKFLSSSVIVTFTFFPDIMSCTAFLICSFWFFSIFNLTNLPHNPFISINLNKVSIFQYLGGCLCANDTWNAKLPADYGCMACQTTLICDYCNSLLHRRQEFRLSHARDKYPALFHLCYLLFPSAHLYNAFCLSPGSAAAFDYVCSLRSYLFFKYFNIILSFLSF